MKNTVLKISSLVLLLCMSACKKNEGNITTSDNQTLNKKAKKEKVSNISNKVTTYGWRKFKKSDFDFEHRDYNTVLHGISRKNFAALDKFVASFDEEYPSGKTKRSTFYHIFRNYDSINNVDPAKWFPTYVANLKEWKKSGNHPEVATIALAHFYINMAWYYRGNGYADAVSAQSWKKFHSYINKAKEEIDGSKLDLSTDPEYFTMKIILDRASDPDVKSTMDTFKEGQKKHPDYLPLYTEMNDFLQEKWHGESEKQWHEFLSTSLTEAKFSEIQKKIIYSAIVKINVRPLVREYDLNTVCEYFSINQRDYLKGLELRCEAHPDSTTHADSFLYYAHLLNDEEATIQALKLTKGCYNAQRWKKHTWFNHLDKIMATFPKTKPLIRLDQN